MASLLGYAGVIPFIVLAYACFFNIEPGKRFGIDDPAVALLGYAAVIMSFIGAVHWGVALRLEAAAQSRLLVYSVLPALVAWLWLLFPIKVALFGMAFTIVVMYFIDRFTLAGLVPEDYLLMRFYLSVIVALSLVFGATGVG